MANPSLQNIRLYSTLWFNAMLGQIQDRAGLRRVVVAGAVFQGSQLAGIWLILRAFPEIAGWTAAEICLLFGLRLAAHATCQVFLAELQGLAKAIQRGELDAYLLRPLPLLPQILTKRFDLGAVGDLFVATVVLLAVAIIAPVHIGALGGVFLAVSVISGALVEGALRLVVAALNFRFGVLSSLHVVLDDLTNTCATYPTVIFGAVGAAILTFVVPIAFIAYIPGTVIVSRHAGEFVPLGWALATPLIAVGLFLLASVAFRWSSRAYVSG